VFFFFFIPSPIQITRPKQFAAPGLVTFLWYQFVTLVVKPCPLTKFILIGDSMLTRAANYSKAEGQRVVGKLKLLPTTALTCGGRRVGQAEAFLRIDCQYTLALGQAIIMLGTNDLLFFGNLAFIISQFNLLLLTLQRCHLKRVLVLSVPFIPKMRHVLGFWAKWRRLNGYLKYEFTPALANAEYLDITQFFFHSKTHHSVNFDQYLRYTGDNSKYGHFDTIQESDEFLNSHKPDVDLIHWNDRSIPFVLNHIQNHIIRFPNPGMVPSPSYVCTQGPSRSQAVGHSLASATLAPVFSPSSSSSARAPSDPCESLSRDPTIHQHSRRSRKAYTRRRTLEARRRDAQATT